MVPKEKIYSLIDIILNEINSYGKSEYEYKNKLEQAIEEGKIKIPIVSSFATDDLSFKLKLQEPQGALIGEKADAFCTIRKTDKNFKYVDEKILKDTGKLLGSNE